MKRAVEVPGAVVVVAALAGGTLLGVLGALVAIPVAAAVILILRQIVMPNQELK
jgi:predicted PurR-regulated permease PerM